MHLIYAYETAGCLEGQFKKKAAKQLHSSRLLADSKYIPAAGHGRKEEGPMVEDLGCNAVFGRLQQAAEETCKLATGKEYVGCDMRLFYNGNKDDSGVRLAQGPHVDGECKVPGAMRLICHMVLPGYEGIIGLKLPANHAGPKQGHGEKVREGVGGGEGASFSRCCMCWCLPVLPALVSVSAACIDVCLCCMCRCLSVLHVLMSACAACSA
jgi:hypothetical protein